MRGAGEKMDGVHSPPPSGVGAISTLGYLFLFIAWRPIAGNFGANALALAICTLFNTAVHRELARNMTGSRHSGRFAGVSAGLFAISLILTSLGLVVAHVLSASSLPVALLAVTVANALASVLRFAILRAWVFRPAAPVPQRPDGGAVEQERTRVPRRYEPRAPRWSARAARAIGLRRMRSRPGHRPTR